MGERENESPYEKSIRIIYVYLGVCVCVYVWPKCKANEAMSEVYVYTNINTTRQAGFCVCVCVCVCVWECIHIHAHTYVGFLGIVMGRFRRLLCALVWRDYAEATTTRICFACRHGHLIRSRGGLFFRSPQHREKVIW